MTWCVSTCLSPLMEACKPERRVFPLEGNHMDEDSFQDGNPMEIGCKLVISMWFPLCFP